MHAALLEERHNRRRTRAGPFLRAAGGDVHVLFVFPAREQELLHRLHFAHQTALGIDRSASPDAARLVDIAGEGRMLPAAVLRIDHVVMAHQQDRLTLGRLRRKAQHETAAGMIHFTAGEDCREERRKAVLERPEFFGILTKSAGHRLDLHHRGKLFGVFLRAARVRLGRLRRFRRRRLQPQRAHAGKCQRSEQRDQRQHNQRTQKHQRQKGQHKKYDQLNHHSSSAPFL